MSSEQKHQKGQGKEKPDSFEPFDQDVFKTGFIEQPEAYRSLQFPSFSPEIERREDGFNMDGPDRAAMSTNDPFSCNGPQLSSKAMGFDVAFQPDGTGNKELSLKELSLQQPSLTLRESNPVAPIEPTTKLPEHLSEMADSVVPKKLPLYTEPNHTLEISLTAKEAFLRVTEQLLALDLSFDVDPGDASEITCYSHKEYSKFRISLFEPGEDSSNKAQCVVEFQRRDGDITVFGKAFAKLKQCLDLENPISDAKEEDEDEAAACVTLDAPLLQTLAEMSNSDMLDESRQGSASLDSIIRASVKRDGDSSALSALFQVNPESLSVFASCVFHMLHSKDAQVALHGSSILSLLSTKTLKELLESRLGHELTKTRCKSKSSPSRHRSRASLASISSAPGDITLNTELQKLLGRKSISRKHDVASLWSMYAINLATVLARSISHPSFSDEERKSIKHLLEDFKASFGRKPNAESASVCRVYLEDSIGEIILRMQEK